MVSNVRLLKISISSTAPSNFNGHSEGRGGGGGGMSKSRFFKGTYEATLDLHGLGDGVQLKKTLHVTDIFCNMLRIGRPSNHRLFNYIFYLVVLSFI